MSEKAKRATISLGELEVDGFQMPDGSYRMSQAQATQAIEEPPVYALRFLGAKGAKALLGEGYTDYKPESVEVESANQSRGQTRINALPLEVVSAYWLYRAFRGNRSAMLLCMALLSENLERRFDAAFGIERTELERNQRLAQRNQQLNQDLKQLGEAYSEPDDLRTQVAYLENQIRQMGGKPWQLPAPEESDE